MDFVAFSNASIQTLPFITLGLMQLKFKGMTGTKE